MNTMAFAGTCGPIRRRQSRSHSATMGLRGTTEHRVTSSIVAYQGDRKGRPYPGYNGTPRHSSHCVFETVYSYWAFTSAGTGEAATFCCAASGGGWAAADLL